MPQNNYIFRYQSDHFIEKHLDKLVYENELWAASPMTFNDPFECIVRIDHEGSDEEWREYIDRRIALAIQMNMHLPPSDINYWREPHNQTMIINGLQNSINNSGIICLSEDPKHPLMWAHYASKHQGICLVFDITTEPFSQCIKVDYKENYVFPRFNAETEELTKKFLLTKAKWWEYEREHRIIYYNKGPGSRQFDERALKAIIVGMKTTDENVIRIKSICQSYKDIQLFRAKKSDNTYDINISPLK